MTRPLLFVVSLLLAWPGIGAEVEPAAATRTLVLVRHGHYAPDPAVDPKLGPALTELGLAQAHLVGARLAGLPESFDTVYASPMTRAQQTAKVIVEDLDGNRVETYTDVTVE